MRWVMRHCHEELGGTLTAGLAHARTVVDNLSVMTDQGRDCKR